jgi:ABC-type dipeptide/oligopeptide/nickel transport system permease subunit
MNMFLFQKKNKTLGSLSLSRKAWKKFKKNKIALASFYFILLTIVVAILGYLITPDSTPDANNQLLQLAVKPPGTRVKILLVKKNMEIEKVSFIKKMLFGQESQFYYIPLYSYSFEGSDLNGEFYTGSNPNNGIIEKYNFTKIIYGNEQGLSVNRSSIDMKTEIEKNNIITKTYLLGTDQEGRDILSRLMIGTRVSLSVGFIAVIISLFIGILLGATAGYYKGKWDSFVLWLISVVWSLPTLLLVISISLALGKGFWQIFIAVGLTMWIDVARIVRGQVISLREETFIEAGKAMGFSTSRIIFRHILPNITGTITVVAADNFAAAILLEAGLSFLGIGAQPPTASWGSMINANRGFIITDSAYLVFLPGICLMLLVLAFFLVGNGLRDALDNKSEASQLVGA